MQCKKDDKNMVKKFEEYINEDYFSKLANRKDNGDKRKENELTEELVMSYYDTDGFSTNGIKITFRKENGVTLVDASDSFYLRDDVEEIPFQFGKIDGAFSSMFSQKLKSLKGCPKKVGGNFVIDYCKSITSLKGCPEEVDGDFMCRYCGKKFTKEYIQSLCKVKGKIFV